MNHSRLPFLTSLACLVALAFLPARADSTGGNTTPASGNLTGNTTAAQPAPKVNKNPVVLIDTSMGLIAVELYPDKAPITVANFLKYVDAGFYSGTIFHRVIPAFMIQGGGFTADLTQKPTLAPIKNEAGNGLTNDLGTIAMARTSDVDSATAQFFINTKDNPFLNHTDDSPQGYGYAVFGKVVDGLDVVKKIEIVPTSYAPNGMGDVPVTPVLIKSIKRK